MAQVRAADVERVVDPVADVAHAAPSNVSAGPSLGAGAPSAGNFVFTLGAGTALVLPQATAEVRLGLGRSTSLELRYRNLALIGHIGQARFTWSTRIGPRWTFGLAARTGIGSLGAGIGEVKTGIDFSSLSLGNDWEVGHDMLLTWTRPQHAHVTWALGPTYVLAGRRYSNYDERAFRWDAHIQSVSASVIGEWELTPSRRFFLRLDALFLIKTEIVPYGFLPTFTIGHAWST